MIFRRRRGDSGFASHLKQDQWVAEVFKGRRDGYFLDFGAFDGREMSNTLYLERELNWTGICVEPNPTYYPALCAERRAICINAALWSRSREVFSFVDAHGLSSFQFLTDGDSNAETRSRATTRVIDVDTVTPTELLDRFRAPRTIEYMSLDVEGCELDILSALDLDRYDIRLMTIEHGSDTARQRAIRKHLASFGYVGREVGYDDFFYRPHAPYPVDPEAALRKLSAG